GRRRHAYVYGTITPMPPRDVRPFTDLFQKAVDQLGSDRAPVRVGGLYGLGLLAQQFPGQRAATLELVCAYLRMPCPVLDPVHADELQVRLVAQRVLAQQLHAANPVRPAAGLDLTGAALVDFDLSACRLDAPARLDRAEFYGSAWLRDAFFGAEVSLRGSRWHGNAWLERAVFAGPARFDGATFRGDAWFGAATFAAPASFAGTVFAGHAWFGGATLRAPANFHGARFAGSAGFRGATCHPGTSMTGVSFAGPARVSRAGERWNLCPPGWRVEVDPDNWCVGDLVPMAELAPTPGS
ncbi:MAG: pentapeptide repeat-containing protein, partial [Micromonosporaceae bacterium]